MIASATALGEGRKKSPHPSRQDLSPCRANLLMLMQTINFGRIEKLHILQGEPAFDPRPAIVREHRFASENGPRPEIGIAEFLLKQHVVELFAFFDQLQNGVIDLLEIRHGLPFRMFVAEAAA